MPFRYCLDHRQSALVERAALFEQVRDGDREPLELGRIGKRPGVGDERVVSLAVEAERLDVFDQVAFVAICGGRRERPFRRPVRIPDARRERRDRRLPRAVGAGAAFDQRVPGPFARVAVFELVECPERGADFADDEALKHRRGGVLGLVPGELFV